MMILRARMATNERVVYDTYIEGGGARGTPGMAGVVGRQFRERLEKVDDDTVIRRVVYLLNIGEVDAGNSLFLR